MAAAAALKVVVVVVGGVVLEVVSVWYQLMILPVMVLAAVAVPVPEQHLQQPLQPMEMETEQAV